jgi:polysaccharide export outer membrane protein
MVLNTLRSEKEMKVVKLYCSYALIVVVGLVLSVGVYAQDKTKNKEPEKIAKIEKGSDPTDVKPRTSVKPDDDQDSKKQDDKVRVKEDDDPDKIVGVYNNYLTEYRLGPNDIISIEVFGQCPDYCKTDITVTPTARISYPLVREGVLVGGKTTTEVADDVTKKLDEYIIDPKVTVTLVKAGSARYSVMGNVASPGVRIMDRRVSIYEAINDAGGVSKGANKKRVLLARFNSQGFLDRKVINLEDIEKGKVATVFLQPGDQVIVPGKAFTWGKFFKVLERASFARILFGSPF